MFFIAGKLSKNDAKDGESFCFQSISKYLVLGGGGNYSHNPEERVYDR